MNAARLFLGVDGGGTHTRAVLADQQGTILGIGRSGSTNRNHFPRDAVRQNLADAMNQAMSAVATGGELSVIFLGMCGVSTEADREDIASIVRDIPLGRQAARVIVENDTRIGLSGGLCGQPGMVLIAGTGSACFGMNAAGEQRSCGGWGALADDVGSAGWIGLRALEAAVRCEDGRIPTTALRKIVFDFLEITSPRQFIDRVHNRGLDRQQIAALAPRVMDAARAGDPAASQILSAAAAELARLVAATAGPLFAHDACELIFVGGVALSGPPFQPMLVNEIHTRTPTVHVRQAAMSPVQGAVLEALRADNVPLTQAVLSNLKNAKCD